MKKQTINTVCFFFVCFLVALQEYVSDLVAYVYEEDNLSCSMAKALYVLWLTPASEVKEGAGKFERTCPFYRSKSYCHLC